MTVEGLVTYPVDYQPGQKYPLAVMTHGGPQAADKYSLGSSSYEIQVLAGKGYVSLQPNYRGSTGYGDAFLRDMIGHYFQNAHLDVMTGVDELIRRGIADPERMVKMGWSAGGHMTNKIITLHQSLQGRVIGRGRRAVGLDVRADRHARVPHAVVRRHAVAEERPDRRVLEQLAAEGRGRRQDADHLLRRRARPASPDAPIGGDVSRAQEQWRRHTSVHRPSRAAWLGQNYGISCSS